MSKKPNRRKDMEGVKIKSRQREITKQAIEYNYDSYLTCFQFIAERIVKINYKLLDLRAKLMTVQPKLEGAIMLEFKNCSKHSHKLCGGCPHPVFKKWFNPQKTKPWAKIDWASSVVKHPTRAINKKGHFKDCHHEVRDIIDEIKNLIAERSRLLKIVGAAKRAINYTGSD